MMNLEEKILEDPPEIMTIEMMDQEEIIIEKKAKEETTINVEIMIETSIIDQIIEDKTTTEHTIEISIEMIDLKETTINQESNTNKREKKIEKDVLH